MEDSEIPIQIIPYVSVDALRFGTSTRKECIASYGQPNKVRKNDLGMEELEYDHFIIRFNPDTHTLCEFTLLPKAKASIGSLYVTWDHEFLRRACEQDGHPLNILGFIVMTNLGIAVTGIHDEDASQLAITVFTKGGFNDLLNESIPFEVPAS